MLRYLDRPDHSRRVASNHSKRCHVFSDDTTSSDRRPVTNVYTRQDDDIASQPAIRPDVDGLSSLRPSSTFSNTWVKRVRSAEEAAVGTNQGTWSDGNFTCVDPCRIGVDEDVGSESGMCVYNQYLGLG